VPVLRLLLRELYGPTYILTIFRSGAERLNSFNEEKYDGSYLLAKLPRHLWFCVEKLAGSEGEVAPSKTCLRLPIGETFLRKANGTRGAFMPRQQVVFYHRFLNNYFML
jgi:hypothetical protein